MYTDFKNTELKTRGGGGTPLRDSVLVSVLVSGFNREQIKAGIASNTAYLRLAEAPS